MTKECRVCPVTQTFCLSCLPSQECALAPRPVGLTSVAYVQDAVNHPKHYTQHPSGVECITITEHFGFNLGNVIKYLWRAEDKGAPVEDLKKARWYLDREIQKREKGK